LNAYLARKDAASRGYNIGMMLGTDGFLAEGSIESVFLVKNGVLITPPLGRVLSSITRMSILQAAPSIGIPTLERAVRLEEMFTADEIFVSHTGIRILPIARFEDRTLDAPGPVTGKLMGLMGRIFSFSEDRFKDWFFPL
jgi:branched-chain amino acid aminotransferase